MGARTAEQLETNLGCLELTLEDSHLEALDDCSKIEFAYPHDFIESEETRKAVYGDVYPLIDR